MHCTRVELGRVTYWSQTLWSWRTMDASEIYSKRLNAKEVIFPKEKENLFFQSKMEESQHLGGDQDLRTSTLIRQRPNSSRMSPWFSWRIRRVSSTTSRLTSGCRWSDKWFLVHVRKLHIPPSRWTQSQNFTRREKNHSLFHSNTLT